MLDGEANRPSNLSPNAELWLFSLGLYWIGWRRLRRRLRQDLAYKWCPVLSNNVGRTFTILGWTLVHAWGKGVWSFKQECQTGHNFTLRLLVWYKFLNLVVCIQMALNFVLKDPKKCIQIMTWTPDRADTQTTTVNIKQQSQDQLVQVQSQVSAAEQTCPKGQTLESDYVHVWICLLVRMCMRRWANS